MGRRTNGKRWRVSPRSTGYKKVMPPKKEGREKKVLASFF